MATLVVTPIDRIGTARLDTLAGAAAGGGDVLPNPLGQSYLYIKNGDGSSHVLTLVYNASATFDGVAVPNHTFTLAAGGLYILGPFDPQKYNDANGNVPFTYSAVTSVVVAGFSQGKS